MNLSFSQKTKLSFKKVNGQRVFIFLRTVSRSLVLLLFLGVLVWMGYVWYVSLYAYDWTEEQKSQYRSQYAGETSFREDRFNWTVDILKERIRLHGENPAVTKDIFTNTPL